MSDLEKDILNDDIQEEVSESPKDKVLKKVLDSIEMAGASLDFFEGKVSQEVEEPNANAEIEAEALESEGFGTLDGDSEDGELFAEEPTEFIENSQALSIMESLLFSADRPMGLGTFKQIFKGSNIKTREIKKLLEDMQSFYAESARGVTLEEINGGWQLRTKVDNMEYLRRLAKARPFKLSGPALEVLSIIAYKQPIVKNEVDEIRGVESGHLIRALMEKHLVSFQGKSELPGKPMQYGTTKKFLEIFGLRNLRELPSLEEIDQLLPDGIGVEEEDEKLSDVTDSLSEDYQGNYSEGEEELQKIEATLGDIDTSSEFFEDEKRRQKDKRDQERARDLREALDVGEEVDPKDQKWLERYEQKLAEDQAKKELEMAAAASIAEDLGELSAEVTTFEDEETQEIETHQMATFDPFADEEDEEEQTT